jgi:hypothetical protein
MVTSRPRFAHPSLLLAAAIAGLAAVFARLHYLHDLAGSLVQTITFILLAGTLYFLAQYALHNDTGAARRVWLVVAAGVLFRLLLLPLPPMLSDDIHRYRWDGTVQVAGWNPYAIAPEDPRLTGLRDGAWEKLPARHLPTIYPPLVELTFRETARTLRNIPLPAAAILWKLPFLAGDLLILALLAWHLRREPATAAARMAIYAWNPLVIVEFSGSGHMDSLAVAALLAAALLLESRRDVAALLVLAAATLLKIFPLVFAPLWLHRTGWPRRAGAWMGLAAGLALALLCMWPYRLAILQWPATVAAVDAGWQLNNASLYALLRWVSGSHELAAGAGLGVVAALALLVAARGEPALRAVPPVLAAITLFSQQSFPWYFTWTLPFLCLQPWTPFTRAWLLLTVTQFLSYHVLINYHALGVWRFEPLFLWLTYAPFFAVWLWAGRRPPVPVV